MKKSAKKYYAGLRNGYAVKIRQLVPKYDEMTRCIVDLLKFSSPATVLDIGTGIGNLSFIVLGEIPNVQLTAVEASEEMISEARAHLPSNETRVSLLHQDILDFSPAGRFDAIFTNLVLHNIPFDRKSKLISTINSWLNPGGIFIWGDLIRYSDPQVQDYFIGERMVHAASAGCSKELIKENFGKEGNEDYPLTLEETLGVARNAGFDDVQNVWTHDTFAVFFIKKENMP